MNMRIKISLLALMVAAVAYGATKGDPSPFGYHGRLTVTADDGGAGSKILVPFAANQNAVAIYNVGAFDAGTAQTVYCGFAGSQALANTTVTPALAFPVPVGAVLSIDIVAMQSGSPTPFDGGVGATNPKLYCTATNVAFSSMDTRWIVVK